MCVNRSLTVTLTPNGEDRAQYLSMSSSLRSFSGISPHSTSTVFIGVDFNCSSCNSDYLNLNNIWFS